MRGEAPSDGPGGSFFDEIATRSLALAHELRIAFRAVAAPDRQHLAKPAGFESGGVRELARRIGISRTVVSQLTRISETTDPAVVLSLLPGPRAIGLLVEGLQRSGVKGGTIERLAEADRRLRELISGKGEGGGKGGRAARLRQAIVADRVGSEASRRTLLAARRDACEAMETILGTRLAAKTSSYLFRPSRDDPGRIDAAIATLFEGVERTRPGPPHELFGPLIRQQARQGPEAVRAAGTDDATWPLVGDLSSPDLVRSGSFFKETGQHPRAQRFFLAGDCPCLDPMHATFLEFAPKVGAMFATEASETATVFTPATWPIGTLVLEVLVHESILGWGVPEAFVTGTTHPETWDHPPRMPLESQVETVETGRLPKPLQAMEPRYREALGRSAAALGAAIGEFRCFRVTIPWPVVRSVVAMRWLLAPAGPADARPERPVRTDSPSRKPRRRR